MNNQKVAKDLRKCEFTKTTKCLNWCNHTGEHFCDIKSICRLTKMSPQNIAQRVFLHAQGDYNLIAELFAITNNRSI